MTIAVTPFDGFCGFRPLEQIASFLQHVPELRQLVGDAEAEKFSAASLDDDNDKKKAALKSLYAALMTAPEDVFKPLTRSLATSASSNPAAFAGKEFGGKTLADLIVRLDSQFPEDIGLFSSLVLNYITLEPGEAIFLRANEPHAYLSGDVVECMAASDNVVRAGFTPKFKDVKNLVEMLTYSYAPIEEQKMKPVPWEKAHGTGSSLLYDPPIEEFAVVRTQLGSGAKEEFEPVAGPSIVIFTEGSGRIRVGPKTENVGRGKVFFVGADAKLELQAAEEEGLVAFRAFCEL
jgi:mannose-6-phosphate isomerase